MARSECSQLHELSLASSGLDREHFSHCLSEETLEMIDIYKTAVILLSKSEDQVDLTGGEGQHFGVADYLSDIVDIHEAAVNDFKAFVREEIIFELFDLNVHHSAARQIKTNIK